MAKLVRILPWLIAALFAVVGVPILTGPEKFMATNGIVAQIPQGAAEIRCFGAGFVSWSAMIVIGLLRPALRQGMFMAVAVAMAIIAVARVFSMVIDGAVEFNLQAMIAEAVIGVILFYAAREPQAPVPVDQ